MNCQKVSNGLQFGFRVMERSVLVYREALFGSARASGPASGTNVAAGDFSYAICSSSFASFQLSFGISF